MNLTEQQIQMMGRALLRHPNARPIQHASRGWENCFTIEGDKLLLWYDDEHGSSHIIAEVME